MNRVAAGRLEAILAEGVGAHVLVVGDLMLDEYINGSVGRISPEAPVPVVHVDSETFAVGGAANVAANIVALGARCTLVGCVGSDTSGERVKSALEQLGVGLEGIVEVAGRPTTVKTRVMARQQQVVRFDREDVSDVPDEVAEELCERIDAATPGAACIVLEDYNKGVLVPSVVRTGLGRAKHEGVPSVVDPKRLRFFEFAGATLFKPNAKELEDALGEPLDPENAAWMERVRERLECETLLLTLGERGMALSSREGLVRIPTVARSVYDVSGAGDTVTATAAVALASGATHVEAAILANHAAAIEVGRAGATTVSPQEILAHIRRDDRD